jgi:hypothetical protein
MARGHEPEEFIGPREVSEERERKAPQPSRNDESRDQVREELAQGAGSHTDPGAARSPEFRQVYEIRGRTYRLRTSEIATMVEVGKFRAIAQEDLTEFAYGSDKGRMRPDVENLIRQGLVQMKSIPHEEKGSRQLLTLTKSATVSSPKTGSPVRIRPFTLASPSHAKLTTTPTSTGSTKKRRTRLNVGADGTSA